ncbi:PAS domain S-box protein [Spirulina subsalsa FACHB-351]|uniref:histidine kinase n=1 Tax=Spirulina subsalsa FACHB-351 TaxID=234711 RepID=A0ABT3L5J1_9CYAN|nr:ATP-binding protein [Spirulina subsalsa]MCW6036776.1 PAS domain S-box protein [Spirulina subsalsa FACHB-351]
MTSLERWRRSFIQSSPWWGTLLIIFLVGSLLILPRPWFVPLIDLVVAAIFAYLLYQLRQEVIEKNRGLRESHARLDLANDMILVRDLNDQITYWNLACQRVYGWTKEEALGENVHELLQTQFPDAVAVIKGQFLARGEWRGELIHTTKTGEKITVSSSWSLYQDERGRPLANLEINQDISEAKKAEAALRKSEKLYRTLADNFPNGAVFLFDQDLRYIIATGAELAVIGVTEPLAGKSVLEVEAPPYLKTLEPLYRDALQGQTTVTEMTLGRGIYQVYVLPVSNEGGEVFAGMVMMQNITASKQGEQTLRTRAEELAKTTAILAETMTSLEKRNQELDQFAYIVSHDLKAPLRAIANLSTWLEEDLAQQLTDETQHQMNLLRSRVRRMEALIEGLLQYSRIDRLKSEHSLVDVQHLLEEVIDSLAPPPGIRIEISAEMPTFQTERLPLLQVFSNLISNGIKHREQPVGIVQISVEDVGDYFQFTVSDDGCGIDPSYHDKIFIMFQTLQARDTIENTGVGLAIVKKIIEDRGGTIHLDSQEGKGAKFSFTWSKKPPSKSKSTLKIQIERQLN